MLHAVLICVRNGRQEVVDVVVVTILSLITGLYEVVPYSAQIEDQHGHY